MDNHRVHTEWQLSIFVVHSIMIENSALAGEGGARRLLRSSRPQEICQPPQQGFFCVRTCPVAVSRKYFSAIHTSPHLNSPHT
jgi:hypothetical protein